jgi:sarcosine oxidase subunit alpha
MLTAPPLRRTPLHSWHARHGAHFLDRLGWQLPAAYGALGRETDAARHGLAVADVSALVKIALVGPGVPALAQELAGNTAACQPRGVAALPVPTGALACRLTESHLLLLAATPDPGPLQGLLAERRAGAAVVQSDVTSAQAGLCLVGQHVEDLLRRLTALDVSAAALPPGACAETGLAGVPALLIRPPGTTPPALHVLVGWDLAEYAWECVLEAGRGFGIQPLGWEGLCSLGLAAG